MSVESRRDTGTPKDGIVAETGKSLIRRLLPHRTAPRRILSGPLRGRRIVTSWHDYPAAITGRTEHQLLAWFKDNARTGQTWLDVGGHYGYTALALAECVGPSGRVFTFEPVVTSAGCIAQTRLANRLDQIAVVPFGLGSPESLDVKRLPISRGMADLTLGDRADSLLWETIQVARFDWLWPRLNGNKPVVHGVKIDVQGMELEVLDGMSGLLREQNPALVVELHRGVDRTRLLEILVAAGYSPEAMPIDPDPNERSATLCDDRSYAFLPSPLIRTPSA
jgi:FkbM family methyltransferase